MPELPEVETVRCGLNESLSGSTIRKVRLMRPDLRIPFPKGLPNLLKGRKIQSVDRRAKYLLWRLDSKDVLIGHLGMNGRFTVNLKPKKLQKHDHVEIILSDGRQVLYHDPRRFGLITLTHEDTLNTHPLIKHLGPEPFEDFFDETHLRSMLSRRNSPIKSALMDQKIVVGVGNIYASEVLFLAGMHPLKPSSEAAPGAANLILIIRRVLSDAIASGGSSLRDFVGISGDTGYFQHNFQVYGRRGQPCNQCGTPIENLQISGRSSFFCPCCQH